MRRAVKLARIAVVVALGIVLGSAVPAGAASNAYFFHPGHPVYFTYGGTASAATSGKCTGGYAIAGTDGMFLLSGECSLVVAPVYGEQRAFGTSRYRNATTSLIQETPPDDAYQIVTDPVTGASPGTGRIVDYMPTAQQVQGTLVGKMGVGSGWTEGRIVGWIPWRGDRAICTTAQTAAGDAGGPVWRWDGAGLRALGTIVAFDPATGTGCYVPIQKTLNDWGAWLPVFGPTAYAPNPGQIDGSIPALDPSAFRVPISIVPAR